MLTSSPHGLDKISIFLLALYYLVFLINLVIDDGINWGLNWALILLFSLFLMAHKKIYLPVPIALTLILPFGSIFLIDLLFHSQQQSSDHTYNTELAPQIINNFLYLLSFLVLPSILYFQQKLVPLLRWIFNISVLVSIFFNAYWNIHLGFDRGLLDEKLRPIILYDACLVSLSLITLIFNFSVKNKSAVFFILLALINLFLIVAHGSRGSWLGIPIILIILSVYYYRSERQKVMLMLFSSVLLSLMLWMLPNNPIDQRIDAMKSDTVQIEQKNYHSSIGTRLFLWQYSLQQFQQSPIYGVGTKQFRDGICQQHEKGLIPTCQVHAHNIFLQFLATHGLIGFFGILSSFLITLIFYIKHLYRKVDQDIACYCMTGMCFSLYFMICGLTDFLFFTAFPSMLYFLITVTLMSFIKIKTNVNTINTNTF